MVKVIQAVMATVLASFGDGERTAKAKLADGTTVNVSVPAQIISISTAYGKLDIPSKDVLTVRLGFRYAPGQEKVIAGFVADLGAKDYKTRERASRELKLLLPASAPLLAAAAGGQDAEAAARAAILLKEASVADREPEVEDEVRTGGMIVRGKVAGLNCRHGLLGVDRLPLHAVRLAAFKAPSTLVKVVVDEDWVNTGVRLSGERTMTVRAEGVVDLWPQQPGQYTCDAKGWMGGGFATGVTRPGRLIGRIGNTGEPFTVDEWWAGTGRIITPGNLFLKVVPAPWNNKSFGHFNARIQVDFAD